MAIVSALKLRLFHYDYQLTLRVDEEIHFRAIGFGHWTV